MAPWRPRLGFYLVPLLLCVTLGAADPVPGTLVELQPVNVSSLGKWQRAFAEKAKADLGAQAEAFQAQGPQAVFKQVLAARVSDSVPSMGLRYSSVDSHNQPRVYSGRIFLPSHTPGKPPKRLPLVIYQHGTETEKRATPYYLAGAETMLGALGAQANGFAVAMPDGDGMGADPSPHTHAYCHAETTAKCLIDLIQAIQGSGKRIFDGINYVWDGRLFIMGYSEGGYIALAAVKELASNPAYQGIKLTGAACMGGPFALAKATRTLLQEGAGTYSRPYIPAYLLAAWAGLYPFDVVFNDAINPLFLNTLPSLAGNSDAGSLGQWLDGRFGGDQISPRMRARLTGSPDQAVTAREVVNEAWAREHVDQEHSTVNQLLAANSLVGGWAPTVPVLLAHDPYDECVGYFNSRALFDDWRSQGLAPMGIIDLALGARGAGHVGGALLSIPTAFVWFGAGMPRTLGTMAVNALRDQVLAVAPAGLGEVVNRAAVLATQEQTQHRAEFPLSRIDYRAEPGSGPWTLSLTDATWIAGKVKLYTLAAFPQYPGQQPLAGTQAYTRFVKQLKTRSDSYRIKANEPCYFAVYPKNGVVALTLGLSGPEAQGALDGQVRIRQVKSKLLGTSQVTLSEQGAFQAARCQRQGFEQPAAPEPFLALQ